MVADTCCRCGRPGGVYDRNARDFFCGDSRECSLRIKRQRRNADAASRWGRGSPPDPRDSEGPGADVGGEVGPEPLCHCGEVRSRHQVGWEYHSFVELSEPGDTDQDGDVPEVAYPYGEWAAATCYRGMICISPDLVFEDRGDAERQAACWGLFLVRVYAGWDSCGADDAPRDCLPE